MLGLQILILSFQNVLFIQAAEMKISNLPLPGNIGYVDPRMDSIYNNHNFEINQHSTQSNRKMKKDITGNEKCNYDHDCKPFKVKPKIYQASNALKDVKILYPKNYKTALGKDCKVSGPCNASVYSTQHKRSINVSSDGALNVIQRDSDDYYDNELIRKLSDKNGKLPPNLEVVVPLDNDPMVIYNETGSLKEINIQKRNTKPMKTSVYDDDVYYDDQQIDNNQLNMDFKLGTNSPVISEKMFVTNLPTLRTVGKKDDIGLNIKQTFDVIKDTFNDKIHSVVRRKEKCPIDPPIQGCYPQGGLPKNPPLPSLKGGKDSMYTKLLRGTTSEAVVSSILEKIRKNPQISTELGICDFDIAEIRSAFKQTCKSKKDCCQKLKGEFKCFLNWLLTIEPSRKKRSEDKANSFRTCNTFPKFDIMAAGDYCKPSLQYEKLAQRVEEYKNENNL